MPAKAIAQKTAVDRRYPPRRQGGFAFRAVLGRMLPAFGKLRFCVPLRVMRCVSDLKP